VRIDEDVAVIVCAGPSLDLLSDAAWRDVQRAGEVVSINGAATAAGVLRHGVRFSCIAAMDMKTGLAAAVPQLPRVWSETNAWRITSVDASDIDAETHVRELDEANGVRGWCDDHDAGYKGGSSGMIVGNWLGNLWPDDDVSRARRESVAAARGKRIPRRGFKRLAFIGLDMVAGDGRHANGAGTHISGFASSSRHFREVSRGWGRFCEQAAKRGIECVNLTPGSGLQQMPRATPPASWLLSDYVLRLAAGERP
jgi:hypothetical protein